MNMFGNNRNENRFKKFKFAEFLKLSGILGCVFYSQWVWADQCSEPSYHQTCRACRTEANAKIMLDPAGTLPAMAGGVFYTQDQTNGGWSKGQIVSGAMNPINLPKFSLYDIQMGWGTLNCERISGRNVNLFLSYVDGDIKNIADGYRWNTTVIRWGDILRGTMSASLTNMSCWQYNNTQHWVDENNLGWPELGHVVGYITYLPMEDGCALNPSSNKHSKNTQKPLASKHNGSKMSVSNKLPNYRLLYKPKQNSIFSEENSHNPPVLWSFSPQDLMSDGGKTLTMSQLQGLCINGPGSQQSCYPMPTRDGITSDLLMLRAGNQYLYFTNSGCPYNGFAQIGPFSGNINDVQFDANDGLQVIGANGSIIWKSGPQLENFNMMYPDIADDSCAIQYSGLTPGERLTLGSSIKSPSGEYEFRLEAQTVGTGATSRMCFNQIAIDQNTKVISRRQFWCTQPLTNPRYSQEYARSVELFVATEPSRIELRSDFLYNDVFSWGKTPDSCVGRRIPLTNLEAAIGQPFNIQDNFMLRVTDAGQLQLYDATSKQTIWQVIGDQGVNPFSLVPGQTPRCNYPWTKFPADERLTTNEFGLVYSRNGDFGLGFQSSANPDPDGDTQTEFCAGPLTQKGGNEWNKRTAICFGRKVPVDQTHVYLNTLYLLKDGNKAKIAFGSTKCTGPVKVLGQAIDLDPAKSFGYLSIANDGNIELNYNDGTPVQVFKPGNITAIGSDSIYETPSSTKCSAARSGKK